jgi:hypothetical protein
MVLPPAPEFELPAVPEVAAPPPAPPLDEPEPAAPCEPAWPVLVPVFVDPDVAEEPPARVPPSSFEALHATNATQRPKTQLP